MVKTYRYRIYPNKSQETMFMKTFGCVRFIYNRMLFDRLKYYRETGKMLFNTPAQYKDTYPFLREVDSLALANAQLHLNNAYKNYFQRKGAGRPRFKSRKSLHQSYATNNQRGSVRIERGHIRLDEARRAAWRDGVSVELTMKEFDLIEFLMKNPGRVYSRENLLNLVWGYDYQGDTRTVDVHIRRLREKLERNPAQPEYIITKWGIGYFFADGKS